MGQEDILEVLAKNPVGLTTEEINKFIPINRSSLYKQLTQLVKYDMIIKKTKESTKRNNVVTYIYFLKVENYVKKWKKQ